jgi:polysaccharide biosynthesis protein PslH
VATTAPPDRRFAPLFARAMTRLPAGPVPPAQASALAAWLRWALPLWQLGQEPLSVDVLGRVAGLSAALPPARAALAAVAAGNLERAEVWERRSERLWSEEWAPYAVAKAAALLDRGHVDEAAATLAEVHRSHHQRFAYRRVREQLAVARGQAPREAPGWGRCHLAGGSVDVRGRRGPARAAAAREAAGIEVTVDVAPSAGAAVEVSLDGLVLGCFPARTGEVLRLVAPVSAAAPLPHPASGRGRPRGAGRRTAGAATGRPAVKVLLVGGRPPWPPRRGDQLRLGQLAAALAADHAVTLLAPAATDEPAPAPGITRVAYRPSRAAAASGAARLLLGGWPLQALPFHQPDLARRLRELAPRHDVTVLQLVRLGPHLRDLDDAPVVADLIDCLSFNVATRASVSPPWLRFPLRWERRRLLVAEQRLVGAARRSLLVCERDRAVLAAALPQLAERLAVAPVAVEAPLEEPSAAETTGAGTATRPTVVLTGNLGYFANRDALESWLAGPWKRLRRSEPELRLVVAGERPPAGLARRLARAGGELVGRPPDLRELIASATVAVAPLRCGSGVPLKVLDAWAAGVPVVASPFAAAGATATPGNDLLVADQPLNGRSRCAPCSPTPVFGVASPPPAALASPSSARNGSTRCCDSW